MSRLYAFVPREDLKKQPSSSKRARLFRMRRLQRSNLNPKLQILQRTSAIKSVRLNFSQIGFLIDFRQISHSYGPTKEIGLLWKLPIEQG